jgi:hypothetical protein
MRTARNIAAVVTTGILVFGSVPASAKVVEKGHYSETDSFFYDDCGFPVEVQVEFSGVFRIREGNHKQETAFFLHDNYSYRETHTNLDTGEFFVIYGNGNFNETKATRVEGSVFEFTGVDAGRVFTVEDSAGNIILRDRGSIRTTILFDTGGDNVPGGTFIEEIDVQVNGPHPGFFVDFCEIASGLIGP